MKPILAIDPGASGGFAWTDSSGRVHCMKMPENEHDIVLFIRSRSCDGIEIIIERVVGYIPGGGAGQMFAFGENFGLLKGITQGLGIPLTLVRPAKWQKYFEFGGKKTRFTKKGQEVKDNTEWKNRLKAKAFKLYPSLAPTLKTADALLILHYAQKNL
jgi:hypothetical protein